MKYILHEMLLDEYGENNKAFIRRLTDFIDSDDCKNLIKYMKREGLTPKSVIEDVNGKEGELLSILKEYIKSSNTKQERHGVSCWMNLLAYLYSGFRDPELNKERERISRKRYKFQLKSIMVIARKGSSQLFKKEFNSFKDANNYLVENLNGILKGSKGGVNDCVDCVVYSKWWDIWEEKEFITIKDYIVIQYDSLQGQQGQSLLNGKMYRLWDYRQDLGDYCNRECYNLEIEGV